MDWRDFCSHLNQYMPPLSRGVRSHLSLAAKRRAEVKDLSCGCVLQSVAFHYVFQHLSSPFWIQTFAPLSTEFSIFHFWSFLQLFMAIFKFNPVCFSGDLHVTALGHFGGTKGVTLIGRGGWWPSRPSPPLQVHTKVPWHAITSPTMDCFFPSLVQPMCRGESRTEVMMLCWGHQPQMGTTSVLAHPQYQMMSWDGRAPCWFSALHEGSDKRDSHAFAPACTGM